MPYTSIVEEPVATPSGSYNPISESGSSGYVPMDTSSVKTSPTPTVEQAVSNTSPSLLNKLSSFGKTAANAINAIAPDNSALGVVKNTITGLPKAFWDFLGPGKIQDYLNTPDGQNAAMNLGIGDVVKSIIPSVAQIPLQLASDISGKNINLKSNFPSIAGDINITSIQNATKEAVQNGENPYKSIVDAVPQSIFDGLMIAGVMEKVFSPRESVVASGVSTNELPGQSEIPQTKSFRLSGVLDQNPATVKSNSLPDEAVSQLKQQVESQGGKFSSQYDPKLPSFWRVTSTPGSPLLGELVQIKPSYFDIFKNSFGGDISKVPETEENVIYEKATSLEDVTKNLENSSPKDVINNVADQIKNPPAVSSEIKTNIQNVASEFKSTTQSKYDTPEIIKARQVSESTPQTQEISTPEREKLRSDVVNKLYGNGAENKNKRLDIVTGGPGMRKSSMIAEPLAKEQGSLLVDSDLAKKELPENNIATHAESTHIAKAVRDRAMKNGDNIVMSTIGDSEKNMNRLIDIAKENGYAVHLHNAQLPLEKSIASGLERSGKGEQGFFDPAYAERVGLRPTEVHDTIKSNEGIESQTKYSTDVAKGEKPNILETSGVSGSSIGLQKMDEGRNQEVSEGLRGISNNQQIGDEGIIYARERNTSNSGNSEGEEFRSNEITDLRERMVGGNLLQAKSISEYTGGVEEDNKRVAKLATRIIGGKEIVAITKDIPFVLNQLGFSKDLTDKLMDVHSKGGVQNIIVPAKGTFSKLSAFGRNTLYLNYDEKNSVIYKTGDILKHELDGHSWYSKLLEDSKQNFYDILKNNSDLIKQAWESGDNPHQNYWDRTVNQIKQSLQNKGLSSARITNLMNDFDIVEKPLTIDQFISETLNLDKTIDALNTELARTGKSPIELKANNTIAVQEHVAMIAENASELVAPEEGALSNYIEDVNNGTLKYGPTSERALTYQGETDLSTTTLEKLKGRDTVSKQFISDLSNSGDLKQAERDIIREVLAGYPDGEKVSVAQFAKDVKIELLPLSSENTSGSPTGRNANSQYENISLPNEIRGNVANYYETIYSSPVKTSAGDVHFGDRGGLDSSHYFGHTRIEDMALPKSSIRKVLDGKTVSGTRDSKGNFIQDQGGIRRVIEVQSDLYQKGNLEREKTPNIDFNNLDQIEVPSVETAIKRNQEISKLQQYNDPTAHFRMVREEVKKAAEDGKTKLQFPTGETAMKIEGLSESGNWRDDGGGMLTQSDLKIGKEVKDISGTEWIITDVLGDGKFKAIPKKNIEEFRKRVRSLNRTNEVIIKAIKTEEPGFHFNSIETFDISGKIDTSNPIYKFYEKDLGRYLKNKYGASQVTDDKGVTWNEVAVKSDMSTEPVIAFRQKTQDMIQLQKMLERVQESLSIAESNPQLHAQAYGSDHIQKYKDRIAELKQRIAEARNPTFKTGNKLDDLRKTLEHVEKRVGLKNAPLDFKGNTLQDLEEKQVVLESMKDVIDNSPLKNLEKYEAQSGIFKGELPEVTGKSLAEIKESKLVGSYKNPDIIKFMQKGDQILTDAGFPDTEEGRVAYQEYKDLKTRYKGLLKNVSKDVKDYQEFVKQDQKSLEETAKQIPISLDELEPPIVRGETQAPKLDFRKWKDVATIRLGRDTFERNLEKMAPKVDADKLKNFIVNPVRENELARVKFTNELKDRFKTKLKELGIKRNTLNDELIQKYGEREISLDELKKLAPKKWQEIDKASNFFRNTYDDLLDTWNEERRKFGYAEIPKVPNYFRHFDEINFFVNAYGLLQSQDELPAEIAGKTEFFKPGKPFSTAELSRTGRSTKYSAIGGFNNYIDSVSKQIFHIDSVQRGRAIERYMENSAKLAKKNGEPLKLSNVIANLREYVNNGLAGKTATLDRAIEGTLGRTFISSLKRFSQLIGKNIIVGNVSTALSHFVTLPLIGATTDKIPLVKGAMSTLISPLRATPFSTVDGQESSFLVRRYPTEEIMPSAPKTAEKALSFLFTTTDKFVAKIAVASKYYEGIKNGLSPAQAIKEADTYAGKVKGDYSIGQKPNIMNTKTLSLLAQFQLGLNDSVSVILHDIPESSKYETKNEKGETVLNKNGWKIASKIIQFIIFSFLFNQLLKNIRGSGKGVDPIDTGLTLAGLNPEGAGQSIPKRIGLATTDLAGELPFTSMFTGNFPLATTISQPVKDIAAGNYAQAMEGILAEMGSPIGGGVQIQKTIQGAQAIQKGESIGAAQNAKSLVFGASKAATPNSAISLKLKTKLKTENTKLSGYDAGTIAQVQPIFNQAKAAGFGTPKADDLVSTLSDYQYKAYQAMKAVDKAQESIDLEAKILPIVEQAQTLGFGTKAADDLITKSFPETPEGDAEYNAYLSVKASYTAKTPTGTVGNNNNGEATFEGHPTYYTGQSGPVASQILGGNSDDGAIKGKNPNGEPLYVRDAALETSRKAEMYRTDPYWKQNGYTLGDTQFDHIVPLETGGTNTANNVQLISKVADEANQTFEDYLGAQYKAGKISRADAAKASIDYKINKTISMTDVENGTY